MDPPRAAAGSRGEEDHDAVLDLQTTDQRLCGYHTRGCGVVFCDRGRALFERAASETMARLRKVATA